jgi:hypothetical protein
MNQMWRVTKPASTRPLRNKNVNSPALARDQGAAARQAFALAASER